MTTSPSSFLVFFFRGARALLGGFGSSPSPSGAFGASFFVRFRLTGCFPVSSTEPSPTTDSPSPTAATTCSFLARAFFGFGSPSTVVSGFFLGRPRFRFAGCGASTATFAADSSFFGSSEEVAATVGRFGSESTLAAGEGLRSGDCSFFLSTTGATSIISSKSLQESSSVPTRDLLKRIVGSTGTCGAFSLPL